MIKAPQKRTYHQSSASETAQTLEVEPGRGLSSDEASRRRAEFGENSLPESGSNSALSILVEQFRSAMVVMLMVAAGLSVYLGDVLDAAAILAIVVLNALLGFVQDMRAERAMAALQALSSPKAHVRRDGRNEEIDASEVVLGDILLLQAGDQVTADGRLVEAQGLSLSEAALTGESMVVEKRADRVLANDTPLAERSNMIYRGTALTRGRAEAVVVAVGKDTELGRIATLLTGVARERTPLQSRLAQFGRVLSFNALGLVALMVALGLIRGEPLEGLLLAGLSLAVAAVPEGLPAVATVALALGARRMLTRHALVRKLPAVETMGSVTVVCTDKTGTLTENRMATAAFALPGHAPHKKDADSKDTEPQASPEVQWLFACAALCNDADGTDDETADSTERALVAGAEALGLSVDRLRASFARVGERPFDSDRMRMSTWHRTQKVAELLTRPPAIDEEASGFACIKGSVGTLLAISTHVLVDGEIRPLDAGLRKDLEATETQLAQDGLRVLGFAMRSLHGTIDADMDVEAEATLIGMIALHDPLRPEARQAVELCQHAGIRLVMITGDHPRTASAIGRSLGFSADAATTRTGSQLDALSDEAFSTQVGRTDIYARVSPEHKLRIVRALQERGEIVAMTGDGVNDAPALKQANIGVAMGRIGTDVAREAADAVLLDDNFATIVYAVEEGRTIFQNIRKFLRYTMTSNAGEIVTMLLGPLLGTPLPLLPLQILWVNLVTDGVPGLALATEPSEPDTMSRPPRAPDAAIFDRALAIDVLWIGLLMGGTSLGTAYLLAHGDTARFRTVVFTVLVLAQLGNALSVRSESRSLFALGLRSNLSLTLTVAISAVVQIALLYIPMLQPIFRTVPLTGSELAISLCASSSVFVACELKKYVQRLRARQ